jgi:hypothetical protein
MGRFKIIAAFVALVGLTGSTPVIYGVFRNDMSRHVPLILMNADIKRLESLTVRAHSVLRVPLFDGTAVITAASGQPLSRCTITVMEGSTPYYDQTKRSYYYLIRDDAIKPVLPKDAHAWSQ